MKDTKTSIAVPVAYLLLSIVVAGLAIISHLGAFRGGETPAFVDLTQGDAYARYGFDTDVINTAPDMADGWVDFYADGSERGSKPLTIHNSGLPGLTRLSLLSPFKKPEYVEFTTLIRVNIPAEQLDYMLGNRLNPTLNPTPLFLCAVSDNWEVYLNGNLVRSEWHVDESGKITLPSARNGIIIPLQSSLFREGDNYFAFRIIGDINATDIGFWMSSPIYLDSYDTIHRQHSDVLLVIIVGIYIMVGFYHLMLFVLNLEDRSSLYYGLASLCAACYGFVRTAYIYLVIQNSYVTSHLEVTSLYLMVPLFGFFLDMAGNKGNIGKVSKIYAAICVLLSVVGLFAAQQFVPYWTVITIVYVLYLYFYRVLYRLIADSKQHGFFYMLTQTLHGSSVIAAAIVVICAVWDFVGLLFNSTMRGLTNYALLMFVASTSFTVARQSAMLQSQVIEMNTILEQSNEHLEESVRERTLNLENARREAEEERLKAEYANETKSTFLAKMSHEIRTPMNAIIGMSELILREDAPVSIRENTLSIRQAGNNLLAIINDILDFSKIESGKIEILRTEYEFSSLMNDCITVIRMRLLEKPIVFTVNVDCRLPGTLIGDEVRIRQILLNLLSNAVKYTDAGIISLNIRKEELADNKIRLFFEVSDTGIGVKDEDIEKLFGDFSQLNSRRNMNIEGTGLGLAITRQLCDAMGGYVGVTSEYGVGSTFTAVVVQEYDVCEPLAEVDKPEEKSVILYETDAATARSISDALENLGVKHRVVKSDDDLRAALDGGEYNYTFVHFEIFDRVHQILNEENYQGTTVVIGDYDASRESKGARTIAAPVYAVSVAGVLNNTDEIGAYTYGQTGTARFTAPAAKVLIVDDVITNIKVAEGLLAPYNMQIFACKSGAQAIRMVQLNDFDLILMDHMMPEMDGIEAAHIIQEGGCGVPIVALTANAVAGTRELFMENGFSDYLAKPIELNKLAEVMDKWIPEDKRV
ncbi:MAG: response regulator [Oscillospiraceae bacterium]|jgi:signal transduction histidine kinase/CheY-like chemotaxis protein|nr:response regulator [Oscillospiraceae bacterium]